MPEPAGALSRVPEPAGTVSPSGYVPAHGQDGSFGAHGKSGGGGGGEGLKGVEGVTEKVVYGRKDCEPPASALVASWSSFSER